ncbi:MAG: hypothetical protein E7199_09755 [Schwartzia succinivorans]|nr:hypothetical protein [Schwartzia succinivorans]
MQEKAHLVRKKFRAGCAFARPQNFFERRKAGGGRRFPMAALRDWSAIQKAGDSFAGEKFLGRTSVFGRQSKNPLCDTLKVV